MVSIGEKKGKVGLVTIHTRTDEDTIKYDPHCEYEIEEIQDAKTHVWLFSFVNCHLQFIRTRQSIIW